MPPEDSVETAADRPVDRQPPTGCRCPSIDADAIFEVANGRLTLNKPQEVASDPAVIGAVCCLPVAGANGEHHQPKQPHRHRFDAADIFQLSRATHPWQAPPIEKAG